MEATVREVPPKQPEIKKIVQLSHHETDLLRQLKWAAERASEQLQDYCNRVIVRHKADPRVCAIDGNLEWIVEIPMEKIQEAIKAAAQNA